MSDPLLVFALTEESAGIFDEYRLLHTGVGKLNAAYSLSKHLTAHKPKPRLVVNLGTAGSRRHNAGTIINATRFIQRDMDVTALGMAPFQTPFSNDPIILEYGRTLPGLPQGLCGSGDNFDITDKALQFDIVDMEAYTLALICQREDIPFLCLKYVSDGANDTARQDWNTALEQAARALKNTLKEIKL